MTREEKIERLEKLYALIPKMKDCKGLCEDTCTVIPTMPLEKERIETAMGKPLKPIKSLFGKIRCSALKAGLCTQYAIRPLICRAFGTVDHPFMRCEHGCVPERWLENKEFIGIMKMAEAIGGSQSYPDVPGWPKLTEEQALAAALEFLK